MLTRIRRLLAPLVFDDEEQTRRARMLNVILLFLLAASIVIPISKLVSGTEHVELVETVQFSLLLGIIILGALWGIRRGYLMLPALLVTLILLGLYSSLITEGGIRDTAIMGYAIVVIVAGLLLGKRAIIVFALLCAGSLGWSFYTEINSPVIVQFSPKPSFEHLVNAFASLSITTVLFYITIRQLTASLEQSLRDERDLVERNRKLQVIRSSLEEQVESRKRSLEIIASLSERLSAILNLEDLLAEVVSQVKDNFDYYHVHIYLFDGKRESLVVAEGTGPAGAEMKARGHSIPLAIPTSLVARAARSGQIVRVDNVREAPDWLPNDLLPDTHSEIAVPIMLEGEVVGVLDVQEDKIGGFNEEDAALLRPLAGQVAVAIRNARYVAEVETALRGAREAQERYIGSAWDSAKIRQQSRGHVRFSLDAAPTLDESAIVVLREEAKRSRQPSVILFNSDDRASSVIPEETDDNRDRQAVVAPIRLGDITIGNLQVHSDDPNRIWSENELSLIEAVVDQLAQAAEGLRLLNITQERANREQLIGQIADKLRRAPDMETLMQVGVSELARVLGSARTFVHLGSAEQLSAKASALPDHNGDLLPPGEA